MKTWQCIVCGFIYDEALGLEEDGIPAVPFGKMSQIIGHAQTAVFPKQILK